MYLKILFNQRIHPVTKKSTLKTGRREGQVHASVKLVDLAGKIFSVVFFEILINTAKDPLERHGDNRP